MTFLVFMLVDDLSSLGIIGLLLSVVGVVMSTILGYRYTGPLVPLFSDLVTATFYFCFLQLLDLK